MQRLRKDKAAENKKLLTLEDWSDFDNVKPFVVAGVIEIKPGFAKRISFGFDTLDEANKAFDDLVLGEKEFADFRKYLNDQFHARYL